MENEKVKIYNYGYALELQCSNYNLVVNGYRMVRKLAVMAVV